MLQVTSGDECWLLQRNLENFKMLDEQLHQCIYDRKISQLPDLANQSPEMDDIEVRIGVYQCEAKLSYVTCPKDVGP